MVDIEKLIEAAKLELAEGLYQELYLPFLNKMETVLDELKIELVRGIVEGEALAKNRYEVVFLKVKSELIPIKPEQVLEGPQYGQMREVIDLQEGDIPISYQTYMSMSSSSASQMVRDVVVLRPVAEDKSDG